MDAQAVRQIGQMVEAGQSLRAVAERVGVSHVTVYRSLVGSGDQYRRRRRRPIGNCDRRAILRLALGGETSLNRIAGAVERSWHTVRRVLESERLVRQTVRHRCPECGYLIEATPCQICTARNAANDFIRRFNADAS